jgi:threonine dehydrogenase-like Zn-dependent dehydrogenase
VKALQVVRPHCFAPVEVPLPHLPSGAPERILVRTEWLSLCGSDIPFFTGSKRHKPYPLPTGAPVHECVGQVVESRSRQFQPGERVVAIPDGDQGLAEFFIAQAAKATALPPGISQPDACCLIQPLSTIMNAVDRLGNVSGRSIAVWPAHRLVLLLLLLRRLRRRRIVGVDPSLHRCAVAAAFGADKTYPSRSIEVVHAARHNPDAWEAPDICIEAVGHQMETLNDCFELVRKRGTVVAFGVPDQPSMPWSSRRSSVEPPADRRCHTRLEREYLPQARSLPAITL